MTTSCPNCLHEWFTKKPMSPQKKLKADGIICPYCKTVFIDTNFMKNFLQAHNIKVNFNPTIIGVMS